MTESKASPEIVIIAALAEKNRVIGKDLDLPWHISEDLKRFKSLTSGHPLLMGRRTFESLVHQFGGPLPNRRNVVLTSRDGLDDYPDVETYPNIEAALDGLSGAERIFIGGGGNVYEQFIDRADRLELTIIEGDYNGDTFFPPYEHLIGELYEPVAVENRDGYRFVTYDRITPRDASPLSPYKSTRK